jgi:hypothetical protein
MAWMLPVWGWSPGRYLFPVQEVDLTSGASALKEAPFNIVDSVGFLSVFLWSLGKSMCDLVEFGLLEALITKLLE